MANELRIRGQEVQIRISQGGQPLRTITAIESLTVTFKQDVLRKGYLGETTERHDDIFKGVGVELTFDPESSDGVVLIQALRDRAARRTSLASTQVNLTAILNFPNGQRPRITIADLKFQDPSIVISGRDAYVGERLNAEADDFVLLGV